MNMMNGINHGWSMGFAWVIGLILLAAVVWLIIKVVNQKNNLSKLNIKSPLELLKKRYARGKIGKKEFEKKKSILQ
jgi:putative membrane protein